MNVDKARELLRELAESLPRYESHLGQIQAEIIGELNRQDLRDRFAMVALIGLLSRELIDPSHLAAQRAYEYADAMIVARKSAGAEAPEQEPPQEEDKKCTC